MKLVSFVRNRAASFGVVVGNGIVDAKARLDGRYETLRAVLAAGALAELGRAVAGKAADFGLADVHLLPPITDPQKVLCVGVNYHEHRKEMGRQESAQPTIFTRFADTQIGHGAALVKPKESNMFDYEGELAVIIGKTARRVSEAQALDHVAGYACYNDGSVRDWQRHTTQFTSGKNFPATGGFGPWMVSVDEAPKWDAMTLTTRLNGEVVQTSPTDMMIFGVPKIIAYLSTFTALNPGDVIPTGTPGGVGFKREPQLFMKPGDSVEVEITGIGTLKNGVVEG
ncbi:MAG: fumarylacetoacetate hydrolase family protein [Alphaproteobacteria bacterium]|nr:fumarylacetoacetate hydrolase family protein [Alphaproteobacteria bacterium]